MEAIEPLQWRSSRIEGEAGRKAEVKSIIRKLNKAANTLHLKSFYSQEQIERLIEGATHLAVNHELETHFFDDPRRCMFLFGITEEWGATEEFAEKRRLLDILSVVAAEPLPGKTLSGKVARLSGKGLERGREFDPHARSTHTNYWERILREARNDYCDQKATEKVETQLKDWGSRSLFATVRETLRVTPKTEQPTSVIVLRLTRQETRERYGCPAMYITEYDQRDASPRHTLILPADYKRNLVEHEYAHLQCKGISSGFGERLDSGLNEALTEEATSCPEGYPAQRTVLAQLENDIPTFRKTARLAYITGAPADLLKMDKLLIAEYGLRGRLAIARMSAELKANFHGQRATGWMKSPDIILQELRQLRKKPKPTTK